MLLQFIKRLQIIIWLLLTFNLTLFYTTIISTVSTITPTVAAAATGEASSSSSSATAVKIGNSQLSALAPVLATTTTTTTMRTTTTLKSLLTNHNKRLQLQLEHHQYQQQQYPAAASYQNYPYIPHIATELMDPFDPSNQPVSMDQQPHQQQQPIEFTSLTHKMKSTFSTTNKSNSRSGTNTNSHMDNNEHNNNIIDINYNSLNGHHNRLHAIKSSGTGMGTTTLHHHSSSSSTMGRNSEGMGSSSSQEEQFPKVPQPYFDLTMPRNITARAGQIAAINCRVENLGDKSVSWIRKRDLHILTAGILTYTSDERFKVTRTSDRKQWSLHIKYAQPRDSGIYECQVNTEPKMSMAFRLNVIVTPPDAKASISGPADLYVKIGSAITLTCHIKQPSSAHDIGPIHWYRGPYILTPFVVHPNEAAIDMQRISMESKLGDKLQSRLRISNAQLADSGNYTCMPTTAEAASVVVNVLNDESPAAMQKSSAAGLKGQNLKKYQQQQYLSTKIKLLILTLLFIFIPPMKLQLWQIKSYYHQQLHHHYHHHNSHCHVNDIKEHHYHHHQQLHQQQLENFKITSLSCSLTYLSS
ncbi:defective proboscis extension response 2 [Cochliomyia hominivorax]